jgi:hypothetical protein
MMPSALPFKRTIGGLQPACDQGVQKLARIKHGDCVMVTVVKSRNIRALRLWWALCSKVAELSSAEGSQWTREDVSDFFKLATGHYRRVIDGKGVEHRFPKSIAFEKMDQTEFGPLLSKAVDLTCERIIPGLPSSDLRNELESMVR